MYMLLRRLAPQGARPHKGLRREDGALTRADEDEMAAWARYMQATFDAVGVEQGNVCGALAPEEGQLLTQADVLSAMPK